MNIYSHLVTLPESCSPYTAHGVIAPDLWPKFTRVYNSSQLNAGNMQSDPIAKYWLVGVQWHIHLDQHFHVFCHYIFDHGKYVTIVILLRHMHIDLCKYCMTATSMYCNY